MTSQGAVFFPSLCQWDGEFHTSSFASKSDTFLLQD